MSFPGTFGEVASAAATKRKIMSAAVLTGPQLAEKKERSLPIPVADEILVRIQGCGICGSNLPVWEGRPWFKYPLEPGAPGHEAWGVIEKVGANAAGFSVGDRVAMLSNHGFAEYDLARTTETILLPESLRDVPFPAEPLGCAFNIARRSAFQSGERVAIVGIGFLGAIVTKLAKLAGAEVIGISRRRFARDMGKEFGADAVFDWTADTVDAGLAALGTRGVDCVIEAVGTQSSLDLATQLTKERGRLIIAGYHQDGVRQVDMQLWNWRGLDVINAHERDPRAYLDGMRSAVEAVSTGVLDPAPLYTHRFSLDALSDAFEMLRLRPDGFMKALVMP